MTVGETVFQFGKHKSKTFEEVTKSEPGYVKWAMGLDQANGQLGEFKQYVESQPITPATQQSVRPHTRILASTPSSHTQLPPSQGSAKADSAISLHVTFCPVGVQRDVPYLGIRLDGFVQREEWANLASTEGFERGASSRDWVFPTDSLSEILERVKARVPYQVHTIPDWILSLVGESFAKPFNQVPLYYRDFPERSERIMPYQREGIQFALEMGLGKSLQALVVAWQWNVTEWPLLVVCPASIRFVWQDQIKQWLPGKINADSVQVIRKGSDVISANSRVVIVGYPMISRPEFQKLPNGRSFQVIICDESHYIKEMTSIRTRAIMPLIKKAKRSILLSGTPALNRAEELYVQFTSLLTVKPPTLTEYRERFCKLIQFTIPTTGARVTKWDGCRNQDDLHALLTKTIMIRRTKAAVLTQLPSKLRHKVMLEPVDNFDSSEVRRLNKEWEKKSVNMEPKQLTELWRLTGLCKQPQAQEYIENIISDCDDKMLVFSHHRVMMDALEVKLREMRIQFIRIDGDTKQDDRAKNVETFQKVPGCRVALLSITACAEGITLTAASVVIFCELYWSPGIMEQAEARAHRVGQHKSVLVHFLVLPDSPDELVFGMLDRKKRDTSAILDGHAHGLGCQIEDELTSPERKLRRLE
jgi:SNF2 family DNA or RNA helicase